MWGVKRFGVVIHQLALRHMIDGVVGALLVTIAGWST